MTVTEYREIIKQSPTPPTNNKTDKIDFKIKMTKDKEELVTLYEQKNKIIAENDQRNKAWAAQLAEYRPDVFEQTGEYPFIKTIAIITI